MPPKQKNTGFTIVELLIVIVVIGILAAITIIAFNGVQARANDTKTRSAVVQITKALALWNSETGDIPRGGWGSTVAYNGENCVDGAGGWLYRGSYACSVEDVLVGKKLLPAGMILAAPRNVHYGTATDGRTSFMFYACSGTNRFALFYTLHQPTAQDTANLTALEGSGCSTTPRLTYGMRAATIVQF